MRPSQSHNQGLHWAACLWILSSCEDRNLEFVHGAGDNLLTSSKDAVESFVSTNSC